MTIDRRRLLLMAASLPLTSRAVAQVHAQENSRFLHEAFDLAAITAALKAERPAIPPPATVTGVTVPHHMLAADLIARGIWAASSGRYSRVLLLAPDHFRSLRAPFGVTTARFTTATGDLATDPSLSGPLLQSDLFEDAGAAAGEHGVHSVLPFLRAVFPALPVVAITCANSGSEADWRRAAALLAELIGPETLVVQSTDFSHHLRREQAVLRDQEALSAISTGRADAILPLNQPQHFDTRAAQFLHSRLQEMHLSGHPVIIGNRNSAEYVPGEGGTTSYVVTAWVSDPVSGAAFRAADHSVTWLAGDLLAGRGFTAILQDGARRSRVIEAVHRRTGGAPLIVNLEGVMMDEQPAAISPSQLFMTTTLALPLLQDLGVVAASLANNHAWDMGEVGLAATKAALAGARILPMEHGKVADVGPFRVLPLTFKRSFFYDHPVIRETETLALACERPAAAPLLALPHWGGDYTDAPADFERRAMQVLADCGVSAAVGAHSHRASAGVELAGGGGLPWVFSLGNFIFDQKGAGVSGQLVEVRVFAQGTLALRPVPLPNLYELALRPAG